MCNVSQENQNIITKKSIEISNEENDTGSNEDIAVIGNQSLFLLRSTDIDCDEGEPSETEQPDVSQIQNPSVNEISDLFTRGLFTSRTRSGRVAGSCRRSLDEWLD